MHTGTVLMFVLGVPVAFVAFVGALITMWKAAIRFVAFTTALDYLVDRVKEIEALLDHELRHNHGGSMKDDTVGTAIAVGEATRRLDALEQAVTEIKETTP